MSTTENNYQETDLGNVSLNPRGEYDPGASYEYLDTVSYQGGSYTCLAELGTTITGIAPDPGRNTDAWQMLTLPGDLKPEYITMHDDTVNHARQAESSRLAAELAQQAAEDAQADIQQLHTDTRQAATEAGQSRDSAAGYAQSADASRKAAAESEQNINAQVTGFDTKVSESVTQAQEEIATTRQRAIWAVASQQVTSTQAVKDQTASYIAEKETSAKTEIGNYTSEKITEINNKASEANTTLANTIADGTTLKTQLETTISTADTSKKNLDASNTAAGKTKTALDTSNTTATKTKANLDASNTTASETKTGLDATNKTAADLVASLGDKITEGTQVKTDIQTTGETAMSNLQAEATKQQEYIKTSIDDTLSISGKAADAAVTGKKIDSLKADLQGMQNKFEFKIEMNIAGILNADPSQPTKISYSDDENACCSDYIDCQNFKYISAKCNSSEWSWVIAFFDANKLFLPDISIVGVLNKLTYEVEIPESAKYVRISHYNIEISHEAKIFFSNENIDANISDLQKRVAAIEAPDDVYNGCEFSIFKKWGLIGDSLSVGHTVSKDGKTTLGRNIYYSWGQYLARRIGNTCLNFGRSGVTSKLWMDTSETYCYPRLINPDNLCQAYIIALGANDSEMTLGSIADVNFTDMTQNADTEYGCYAKVINAVRNVSANVPIFLFTLPYPRNSDAKIKAINEMIRTFASDKEHFGKIFLVDLDADYNKYFETGKLEAQIGNTGWHLTSLGYLYASKVNEIALSRVISDNYSDFQDVFLLPCGNNNALD